MHKPIGILAEGEHKIAAQINCTEFLDKNAERGEWIDWYQGIKESRRWDLNKYVDTPIMIIENGEERWDNRKSNELIREFIKYSQEAFKRWYDMGQELIEKNGFKKELGHTADYFRYAGDNMSCWLFDNTGWSGGGGVRDIQTYNKIKKWILEENKGKNYWLCLYDIHY